MFKKIFVVGLLILLGLVSCVDNDGIGSMDKTGLLRFDFPQGNDPWDKEIEQIAKDWGMYIIYKDVDSTHLNRMWTTPSYNDPIYVCQTPGPEEIQIYLALVKEWLLSGLDKNNETDRRELPFYLYLVNNLNDGNPHSGTYQKNHIRLKKDGLDYWSLSFTSKELSTDLTSAIIHDVACSFSYPAIKSSFQTGAYQVAPEFAAMTDYESRIGQRYCSFEQFLKENPGAPDFFYEMIVHASERDSENAFLRRGFAPMVSETFKVGASSDNRFGAPTFMPWITQLEPWGESDRNPGKTTVSDDLAERAKSDFINMIRLAMLYSEKKMLEKFPLDAEDPLDQAGNQKIKAKYDLVVEYMKTTYGEDLPKYAAILEN